MTEEIIRSNHLAQWLETPSGQHLLHWEQQVADQLTSDWFGYYAVQVELEKLQALRENRMTKRWLALAGVQPGGADLHIDLCALPFAEDSIDLIVLPHTLELSPNPHATLREVARVLVPEGRLLIFGLNPNSLWGWRISRDRLRQRFFQSKPFFPMPVEFIGSRRLRDWLHLLNFDTDAMRYGCYKPSIQATNWLRRMEWIERAGGRWWPFLGAVYAQVAIKRVHGMRLIEPAWRERKQTARELIATRTAGTASPHSHIRMSAP